MSASLQADRARFDDLVRDVIEPVRRYLRRRVDEATADDVVSEVLVVLWRQQASVPDEGEIAYAIGVARLQLQNALRSMRRQERLVARIISVDPPQERAPEPLVDPRAGLVATALAHLSDSEAEILRLHVWEELPVTDIAQILEITPNAVSIRLHRAKKKMVASIRKLGPTFGHDEAMKGDTA